MTESEKITWAAWAKVKDQIEAFDGPYPSWLFKILVDLTDHMYKKRWESAMELIIQIQDKLPQSTKIYMN